MDINLRVGTRTVALWGVLVAAAALCVVCFVLEAAAAAKRAEYARVPASPLSNTWLKVPQIPSYTSVSGLL